MTSGSTGDFEGSMEGLENSFSIIIPTYRRPKQLEACLASVAQLEYPRDCFEVLVVDDGAEIPPEDVVRAFSGKINVKLLKQAHGGPAAARNTGAERAKGRFLAFTDDDCAPSPTWLGTMAKHLAAVPGAAVGGHTVNALIDNPYSTASQMLTDYLYSYFYANYRAESFFVSNNLAVPADRFCAIGGFDTSFHRAAQEDREFCDRWLRNGNRLVYAPEAVVYHSHSLTLLKFWRQHFNYGRSAPHFREVHLERSRERVRMEPFKFYLNMLRHPFLHGSSGRALPVSMLMALSQVAYIGGAFWEMSVNRIKLARHKDS